MSDFSTFLTFMQEFCTSGLGRLLPSKPIQRLCIEFMGCTWRKRVLTAKPPFESPRPNGRCIMKAPVATQMSNAHRAHWSRR